MSIADELNLLWEMNGEQPHETPGPSPHSFAGQARHKEFDPLSAGASKAVQQVRESLGAKNQNNARPFVEALGNLGTELLRTGDIENGISPRQGNFNPYAEQDAQLAQNMKIMEFLQEAQLARQKHEETTQHNRALENYYGRKPAGARQYAPSNLGKLYQERDNAIAMFGEDSSQANAYDLAILKATTDTDTRQRTLFASNLEKNLNMINVDDLVQYSGVKGQLQLKADQAQALAGHPPERYLRYKDAIGQQQLASEQMKVFLKGANSERALEHFEKLSNPSALGESPEAAKRQFESSKKVLETELGTYYGGVSHTREHKGSHGLNSEIKLSDKPISQMSREEKLAERQKVIQLMKNRDKTKGLH